MTLQTETTSRVVAAKSPRLSRVDNEFLPAALEILETPLSPIRLTLTLSICALVVAALAWSYIGRIDIIATAQGKIQPIGRSKIIEPIETGRVSALNIENGRRVTAGAVLLELDDRDARADEAVLAAALQSSQAEVLRRTLALNTTMARQPVAIPEIVWPPGIADDVKLREQRVLASDLTQLSSEVASLGAQRGEKIAQRERTAATIAAQEELVATLKERVDMRTTLFSKESGSRASVLDAEETYRYHAATLATDRGQLGEIEAGLRSVQADIDKTYSAFVEDNAQRLATAERSVEDNQQKLAKARLKTAHMILRSPIDGIVQGLSVTTIGQVVTTGEQIVQIVPEHASIEIEAYLPNGDIGFVRQGQPAVIKVEAFPFTTYGTIDAHVTRVGFDALPANDASQNEANPTLSEKKTAFAGMQRMQNLVYPVTLTLDRSTIDIDGAEVPLLPGMAVTVEIKTGKRRILEYLFSPLVQIGSTALKER